MHMRQLPLFFLMRIGLASHSERITSLMTIIQELLGYHLGSLLMLYRQILVFLLIEFLARVDIEMILNDSSIISAKVFWDQ